MTAIQELGWGLAQVGLEIVDKMGLVIIAVSQHQVHQLLLIAAADCFENGIELDDLAILFGSDANHLLKCSPEVPFADIGMSSQFIHPYVAMFPEYDLHCIIQEIDGFNI